MTITTWFDDFIVVFQQSCHHKQFFKLNAFQFPPCSRADSYYCHISPHCDIVTGILGLLFGFVGTFSIFLRTSMPSITRPTRRKQTLKILKHESIKVLTIFTEHNVFIIKKRSGIARYKKLTSIGVFSTVCLKSFKERMVLKLNTIEHERNKVTHHWKKTRSSVLHFEVFISKCSSSINAHHTSTITLNGQSKTVTAFFFMFLKH